MPANVLASDVGSGTNVEAVSRLSGLAVLVGPLEAHSPQLTSAVVGRLVSEGAQVAVCAVEGGPDRLSPAWSSSVAAVEIAADPDQTSLWSAAIAGAMAAFGRLDAVVYVSADGIAEVIAEYGTDHMAATGGGAFVALAVPMEHRVDDELVHRLGGLGIRINTVVPGPTGGSAARNGVLFDGDQRREVTPGDVAAMAAFLLSDDSATCTGATFRVDAGAPATR